jgi:hypothetical protein
MWKISSAATLAALILSFLSACSTPNIPNYRDYGQPTKEPGVGTTTKP